VSQAVIAALAPGRLIFGAGIGGEDRHEVAICGVDPATRGKRMDECLAIVRQLLSGKPVTCHGTFVDLDEAVIAPTPPRAAQNSTSSLSHPTTIRPSPTRLR